MRLLALKSILVATDLDEASKPALRTAARLAALAGARLHLLHVSGDPDHDVDRLITHYRNVVNDAGEPDTVEVLPGQPAEVIVAHTRKVSADAVVVGPHRKVGTAADMGSTAARVVRTAPCPCVVAATELNLPLERILAPVDSSEIAGGALSVALTWGSALRPRQGAAHLTALHVATETNASPRPALGEQVERARARAGGAARVEIDERITVAEDPADAILQLAAAERADLLVMGTRGTARAASGLGSVSAAVARGTPCPLLLVPEATWSAYDAEPSLLTRP